jgi:hypothetical protein
VSLGTRPENVRLAVDSVRAELARLPDGVTQDELDGARDYLTGSFPLRFTTYGRLARFWTRSSFYGWPEDYLDRYVERVRALQPADLARVGARLAAASGYLAVAGPVDGNLEPLPGSGEAEADERAACAGPGEMSRSITSASCAPSCSSRCSRSPPAPWWAGSCPNRRSTGSSVRRSPVR